MAAVELRGTRSLSDVNGACITSLARTFDQSAVGSGECRATPKVLSETGRVLATHYTPSRRILACK